MHPGMGKSLTRSIVSVIFKEIPHQSANSNLIASAMQVALIFHKIDPLCQIPYDLPLTMYKTG